MMQLLLPSLSDAAREAGVELRMQRGLLFRAAPITPRNASAVRPGRSHLC